MEADLPQLVEREVATNSLPDTYYDEAFDPLDYELSRLSLNTGPEHLEAVADERSSVLDAVTERFSHHISHEYDSFMERVEDILGLERKISETVIALKISREHLAVAGAEVQRGLQIWRQTRLKQRLSELVYIASQVQRAFRLLAGLQNSLGEGNFCLALCYIAATAEACGALQSKDLNIMGSLNDALSSAFDGAVLMCRSTAKALTTEFQEGPFLMVLHAYALIHETFEAPRDVTGKTIDMSQDLMEIFCVAPQLSMQKVLRGVLLTRQGMEDRIGEKSDIKVMVNLLPRDLFRSCLSSFLMIFWDIMAAHSNMEGWLNGMQESGNAPLFTSMYLDFIAETPLVSADLHTKSIVNLIHTAKETMPTSKRNVWDSGVEVLGLLLDKALPIDGETLLCLLEWMTLLSYIGELFIGFQTTDFQNRAQKQASAFFHLHHITNLEALKSLLEKEAWKALPMDAASVTQDFSPYQSKIKKICHYISPSHDFKEILKLGNPWATLYPECSERKRRQEQIKHPLAIDQPPVAAVSGAQVTRQQRVSGSRKEKLTNTSWRIVNWMQDYSEFTMSSPFMATQVFMGLMELFDAYALYIYYVFVSGQDDEIKGRAMVGTIQGTEKNENKAVSNCLSRESNEDVIATIKLYSDLIIEAKEINVRLPRLYLSDASGVQGSDKSRIEGLELPLQARPILHSGNMFGIPERFTAGESLIAIANNLSSGILSYQGKISDSKKPLLEAFSKYAPVISEIVLEAALIQGCRLMLPLAWLENAIAAVDYQISDPPSKPSSWTVQLARQFEFFYAQISHPGILEPQSIQTLWTYASKLLSVSIVEGLSRVKRCSLEGRSLQSLDLQAVTKSLMQLKADGELVLEVMREVDDFIKAFYLPLMELPGWAVTHPVYRPHQIFALAACMSESSGLKRREQSALLSRVESDLRALGIDRR